MAAVLETLQGSAAAPALVVALARPGVLLLRPVLQVRSVIGARAGVAAEA